MASVTSSSSEVQKQPFDQQSSLLLDQLHATLFWNSS